MTAEPIIMDELLAAPVHIVWNALTDSTEMKAWYFDLPGFTPEVGYEFTFSGGTEEKSYLHLCRVTEVAEQKILTYSWRYDGYAGNSFVTWELFGEEDRTRVKLTHTGLETFPADNPDFDKKNFLQGWTDIITKSLKQYVETKAKEEPGTNP